MNGIVHPFTRALYEQDGNGNILVTRGDQQGLFRTDGKYISGELLDCDPQLCGWVGGPMAVHHRVSIATPQDEGAPFS